MEKLDLDRLYDEAEEAGRIGICCDCGEEHVLCWCGQCFKYCHDEYEHNPYYDPDDPDLSGVAK